MNGMRRSWQAALRLAVFGANSARCEFRNFSSSPRKTKFVRESWSFLSDIAGNPALAGKGWRVSKGEILKLMDLAAASSAIMHIGHGRLNTLAFDHFESVTPIFHGDQIHVDSRVVHVGNSTVAVHCVGRKRDLLSRAWIHTHEGLVVFVALGADGRPESAPELLCETANEQRFRDMVIQRLTLGKQYAKEQLDITPDWKPEPGTEVVSNRKYKELIDIEDTHLR
jgi:acyl-CoA hydrolase